MVMLSTNSSIAKAISEERAFTCPVTRIVPASGSVPMHIPVTVSISVGGKSSVPGVIYADEIDMNTSHPNAAYLVGQTISFVIKEADDEKGILICSRKVTQQKAKAALLQSFAAGTAFDGVITGFARFGAFVEVNGVSGLLRNADYSTDHSRVNERYRVGDRISVKCKSVGQDERHLITWETVTKYHRSTPFVCDVEAGSVVLGTVVGIRNFPQSMGVFVRVDDNEDLDILCSMPPEMEVEYGVHVAVRVSSVDTGQDEFSRPRIRGRILRLA